MVDNFKITKIKRESYFNMKSSHLHSIYEIYYLVSGTRKIFIDDSIYILNRGDLVFIPMNTIHKTAYINDKSHERIAVLFDDKTVPDIKNAEMKISFKKLFKSEPVIHISGTHREYIEGLFNVMLNEYNQQDRFSDINIRNCMQQLIIFLIRYKQYKNNEYAPNINMNDSLMQEAARYIRVNYRKNISLEDVAEHVNISPTYFSKKFKASTGFGYREYLINVRLQQACDLLLETNMSITEIALECGFNDSNYFGDVFRRAKGLSPLKYRKNNKYI